MNKVSTRATARDGKFHHASIERVREIADAFEGKDVRITFEPWRDQRTTQQNKYYWFLVGEIAEHIGIRDHEDVHAMLKFELNSTPVFGAVFGAAPHQFVRVPKSTANLTTEEFSRYVDMVKEWAANFLHLNLPDANEVAL